MIQVTRGANPRRMSGAFPIAILPVSPGAIGVARLPGMGGDLAGDLAAIGRFAPGLVVSMTEADEMRALGAGALPEALRALRIDWAHFPIVDFGTPPAGSDWSALAARCHAQLDAGARVLLHCRGGKGRSGMVALRLMVERGEAPVAALARLRAARPGAVETRAQEAWAGLAS